MNIREASPTDYANVLNAGRDFFEESNFRKLTWDDDAARRVAHQLVGGGEEINTLIAENDDGEFMGFTTWTYEKYWCVEKVAHLFLFYVKPEFRNGSIAPRLVSEMNNRMFADDVALCYASSTGGFEDNGANERAFTKLMTRQGFEVMGAFLSKQFKGKT